MKILSASVTNFGSYKNLEFDFSNQGLTLISGHTGAGKSTLCDIIPWILFGRTAKNGTVDEVRSWNAEDQTHGIIVIKIGKWQYSVHRSRGETTKDNDLWLNNEDGVVRGKDMSDTQKLINNLLGLDADLYLSGAYFHEFSQTAQFFTTNAKIRRQITEQMVDLTLAKKLTENLASYKKDLKKEQEALNQQLLLKKDRLQHLNIQLTSIKQKQGNWEIEQKAKLLKLEEQYELFDKVKAHTIKKLEDKLIKYDQELSREVKNIKEEVAKLTSNIPKTYSIDKRIELEQAIKDCDKELCDHCGAPKKNTQKMMFINQLHDYKLVEQRIVNLQAEIVNLQNRLERNYKLTNPYIDQVKQEKIRENTYLMQLDLARMEENPYTNQVLIDMNHKDSLHSEINELQGDTGIVQTELSDVELLSQVTDDFRSVLVRNIIGELQYSVNNMLTKHFDAEIKVTFETAENDKLDVTIMKDGNLCSFSQLSKGQRQLLKLCFGVSVMTCIQNHHGISFNCLFLDEAFEGLSEQLKIQSYSLLQSLAINYESVFVVEHSQELKSMFENKIEVELINGNSAVTNS